jgi:hypothetical protein
MDERIRERAETSDRFWRIAHELVVTCLKLWDEESGAEPWRGRLIKRLLKEVVIPLHGELQALSEEHRFVAECTVIAAILARYVELMNRIRCSPN